MGTNYVALPDAGGWYLIAATVHGIRIWQHGETKEWRTFGLEDLAGDRYVEATEWLRTARDAARAGEELPHIEPHDGLMTPDDLKTLIGMDAEGFETGSHDDQR